MRPVHATARTKLPQFDAVRVVSLVLLRRVRPLLALRAGQVNHHAVLFLGHLTPVLW